MKKQYSVAILLAIFVFALCGAACGNARLSTPENIRIEADYLTWDKVDGADAYLVTINGETTVTKENKYDLLDVTREYVTYKMSVLAMSATPDNDSLPSKMLVYKPQPAEGLFNYSKIKSGNKEGMEISLKSGISESDIPEKLIIPATYTAPGTDSSVSVIRIKKLSNDKTKSIWIPNSVESIADGAFSGSSQLERIKLPARLSSIGSIFDNCVKLQSVTLPSNLEKMANDAFDYCESLEELVFPESFKSFTSSSSAVFKGCSSLKKIEVTQSDPEKTGNYYVKDGCLIENKTKKLMKAVGNFTVPEDVTSINLFAFADNRELTDFTVPDNVLDIPSGAFSGCVNLKTINLNKATSFDSIYYPIFADCTSLTSVTFPKTTASILGNPFKNCTSLTSVEVDSECSDYRSVNNFIIGDETLVCGLKASGFPLGIKQIGGYAFAYSDIEEAIIPSGVELSTGSFAYCNDLKKVTLPDGLTNIPAGAFYDCYNLENVALPESVVLLDNSSFANCFKLSLTISSRVNVLVGALNGVTVYTEAPLSKTMSIDASTFYYGYWSDNGSLFASASVSTESRKPYIVSFTLIKTTGNDQTFDIRGTAASKAYYTGSSRVTPYREGYEFAGWKTSADGEVVYKPYTVTPDYENMTDYKACLTDDELKAIANGTTLYAEWEKI